MDKIFNPLFRNSYAISKNSKRKKYIAIIGAILLLIAVFFLTDKFGLRRETVNKPADIVSVPLDKIPFCPVADELCKEYEPIFQDNQYIGSGFKAPANTDIIAAFDGDVSSSYATVSASLDGKTITSNFKVLYLDNVKSKSHGVYFFKGDIVKIGSVFKGEKIALVKNKRIKVYNDSSLVFSIIFNYPDSKTPIFFDTPKFKQ